MSGKLFGGAEMAGIKFHGAIDVVISGNHIYRCGHVGGIWLDWMAQGTQVTGQSAPRQHRRLRHLLRGGARPVPGRQQPLPLAWRPYLANSQGGAYAHNLITGSISQHRHDGRRTPYHKAHSTELVGMHDCPVGDVPLYNNLLAGCNLSAFDRRPGRWQPRNVFTKGAQPSKFDTDALQRRTSISRPGWSKRPTAGIYDGRRERLGEGAKRALVTTELLGKAKIPDLPFENPDGSPLSSTPTTSARSATRTTRSPVRSRFPRAASSSQGLAAGSWKTGLS